jgi:hypothetical protein
MLKAEQPTSFNYDAFDYLLPAVFRTFEVFEPASLSDDFLEDELNVYRLEDPAVYKYLWFASDQAEPRSLTAHKSLGRDIKPVEILDLHLVWDSSSVLIRPIPRYLLSPMFWGIYLYCRPSSSCTCYEQSKEAVEEKSKKSDNQCDRARRYHTALGFLRSYAALIRYESDFRIAEEAHLLPEGVTWTKWRMFVKQILDRENKCLSKRFRYGDLRLGGLNTIYRFRYLQYGYRAVYQEYSSFLRDNITAILSFIAYITIVLTAMQLGLATDRLGKNDTFQKISFGFTVFSIIAPLALVLVLGCVFLTLLFWDNERTRLYRKSKENEENEDKRGPGDLGRTPVTAQEIRIMRYAENAAEPVQAYIHGRGPTYMQTETEVEIDSPQEEMEASGPFQADMDKLSSASTSNDRRREKQRRIDRMYQRTHDTVQVAAIRMPEELVEERETEEKEEDVNVDES